MFLDRFFSARSVRCTAESPSCFPRSLYSPFLIWHLRWRPIGLHLLFSDSSLGRAGHRPFRLFLRKLFYAPNRIRVHLLAAANAKLLPRINADVYSNPAIRGRAMCVFIAATTIGPLLGPIISGFISPALGWRWSFWIALLIAGISWIPLLFLPETYAPVILQRRAAQIRATTRRKNNFAPLELEPKGWRTFLTVVLARPLRMFFTEAIVLFTCLYLALIYAIYFMFFQSYPVIFQGAQS